MRDQRLTLYLQWENQGRYRFCDWAKAQTPNRFTDQSSRTLAVDHTFFSCSSGKSQENQSKYVS